MTAEQYRRWLPAGAAVLAAGAAVLGVGGCGTGDGTRSDDAAEVPCAEALRFGGATAPAGSDTVRCTTHHGIDVSYDAELRMPRGDVRGWLRATYPDAPPVQTGDACLDDGTDLCLDVVHGQGLPDGVGAHAVQVHVAYEGGGTARVRFTAFTM